MDDSNREIIFSREPSRVKAGALEVEAHRRVAPDTVRGTTDRKDRRRSAAIAAINVGRWNEIRRACGLTRFAIEGLGRVGRASL